MPRNSQNILKVGGEGKKRKVTKKKQHVAGWGLLHRAKKGRACFMTPPNGKPGGRRQEKKQDGSPDDGLAKKKRPRHKTNPQGDER